MLMNAADYRESLRRYKPRVFVDGERIESVADEPPLAARHQRHRRDLRLRAARRPGAGDARGAGLERQDRQPDAADRQQQRRPAEQARGRAPRSARRPAAPSATCRTTRFSALRQATARIDADTRHATTGERFLAYLHDVQDEDLTLGIAMTDAKGDRCKRPHEQANPDSYVHIVERSADGHRHLGHQGDRHRRALRARVPGHAVPQHDRGRRRLRRLLRRADRRRRPHHRRAPGRPARRERRRCSRSKYGQSTGVRHLRPRLRAVGARVPRRRVGARGDAHLQLRHPPPPYLHRAPAPASATC